MARGFIIYDGFHHCSYDAEGNMITVDSGQTATYVYNALNQRVQTVAGGATTGYVFNAGGQRVSEWS
jgi:YD repeat-containing protein